MGLFSGITNALFGGGGSDSVQRALDELNITLPELKEMNPELYQQVVKLNPEMETAVNLGPSALEGISTDPALRLAQMKALQSLQEQGRGEFNLTDEANLRRVENDVNRNLQGQQQAIMQNLAARGLSGGGNELVARQLAAQSGANRQADMDLQVRAEAERRALQALAQSGQLAGNMENAQFGRSAQVANAKDAIARFNAQNQQGVMSRNVGSKNQAQQWNASNAQNVANQNVGVKNQAQQYNLSLAQQRFDNEMRRAAARAGQYNTIAGQQNRERESDMGIWGGILQGSAYALNPGSGGK